MNQNRQVLNIPIGAVPREEAALRMKKHAGIDVDNVPAKYGSSVTDAHGYIESRLKIAAVYQIFSVASVGENEAVLQNGVRFTGEMAPRILKGAKYAACFVATLPGFNDVRDTMDDIMDNYFLDTWGTVYAECGTAMVESSLAARLDGSGYRAAYAWNPGQHRFDLCNQRGLFALLQPEDIGCVLDKHMRMIPFKSTSGVIPIFAEDTPRENDLIPCDFCSMGRTCPASKARNRG